MLNLLKSNFWLILAYIPLYLYCSISSAQEFTILNKSSNKPVPFAQIKFDNGSGIMADNNGKFKIKSNTVDSIVITSLGYKAKKISLKGLKKEELIFFLDESAVLLNEAVVKKRKTKTLKHPKPFKIKIKVRDFTYNEVVITHIPYPKELSDNITIKNIVVNSTGLLSKKRRYYPFKVNLYTSKKKGFPPNRKDSLLAGIITSRERGKGNFVKINIEDYNITLPPEGIYVSFETLSSKYYPKDTLYKTLKRVENIEIDNYNNYAAAVQTIKIDIKKSRSYSFSLKRKSYKELNGELINEEYWQMEKDFLYDLTLEIKY